MYTYKNEQTKLIKFIIIVVGDTYQHDTIGINDEMETDEIIAAITTEHSSSATGTTVNYILQKKLAKLIIDIKYESKMHQTAVDSLLCRFKSFFNEAADLFLAKVSLLSCFLNIMRILDHML